MLKIYFLVSIFTPGPNFRLSLHTVKSKYNLNPVCPSHLLALLPLCLKIWNYLQTPKVA